MSPDEKKAKLIDGNSPKHPVVDLSGFKITEVLAEHATQKSVSVLMEKVVEAENIQAIIKLEKKSFDRTSLQNLLDSPRSLRMEMNNDVYGTYHMLPGEEFCDLFTTIIMPADETHIAKARQTEQFLVNETPEDYQKLTLPFVEKRALGLQWVYNLLDHKAEVERITFEDPSDETGFMLAPDLKWDGSNVNELYLSAIVRKHGIKSIRDLTTEHLPLLRNMLETIPKVIQEKYSLAPSQLRLYFHYQPSFYHLHVHCVALNHETNGQRAGQAVLLQDVIDNIFMYPDYYSKKTLMFTTKKGHPLHDVYTEAGKI